MEMEEPMFSIQMFTGSRRDSGTQMISRDLPTAPSSYSSQITSDSYIVRIVPLYKFFQAVKGKDKKNFLYFLFIKKIQPQLIFMRHLGVANITSLQCQYCIVCYLLHLYSTLWLPLCCCSVTKLYLTLWPHGLPQHTRLLCPPLSPRVSSNSCPLGRRCYLAISSSLSSPSLPALTLSQHHGLFQWVVSASSGQNVGASTLASVLPMNIQGWFSFRIDWFDCVAVQGTLESSPAPQFKGINSWALNLVDGPAHIHTWPLEKPQLWL